MRLRYTYRDSQRYLNAPQKSHNVILYYNIQNCITSVHLMSPFFKETRVFTAINVDNWLLPPNFFVLSNWCACHLAVEIFGRSSIKNSETKGLIAMK